MSAVAGVSAVAGEITREPLAAARLRTLAASTEADDEQPSPPATVRPTREVIVFALAAALLALLVAVAAQTMTGSDAEAVSVTPDTVFVVDPDGKEPFVVCTDRGATRRCGYLDLNPGQP